MIEASVSANGASPVDSQFEPIQKPSTAVSFSPYLSSSLPVVAVKISNGKIATFVFTNSIEESLRPADPLRESPSPASAETAATAPGAAARTHPPATPLQPGRTSAAQAGHHRLHRVPRTSDHTGLPSTRVTASVLGDALGMVGRPVSTGLHDSCRLSSFLTRWTAGG